MTASLTQTDRVCSDHRLSQRSVAQRVAIIGGGPRGTFCLGGLVDAIRGFDLQHPIAVDVYEPAENCGAGSVYRPGQPPHRVMNYTSGQIDVWPPADDRARQIGELSLTEWLSKHYPRLARPDFCVPRTIVGEYLTDAFERITANAPSSLTIRVIPECVRQIVREGSAWRLSAKRSRKYDEVMLTIGHGPPSPAVQSNRKVEDANSGSRVAVRGFALTFIDACLDLTEGRGGRFASQGDRLTYQPSGNEPAAIFPYSRTGRPMLAKPPSLELTVSQRDALTKGVERLNNVGRRDSDVSFTDGIWPIFVETASRLGGTVRSSELSGAAEEWFGSWLDQTTDPIAVRVRLEQACRIRPDSPMAKLDRAFGIVWRELYPGLVEILRLGLLADEAWKDFWKVAREMERVAFGPPAVNARKILALIDYGVIDLSHLRTPADADIAIDCVIPAPHAVARDGLLDQLLNDGHATREPRDGGIRTLPDGTAVGCHGTATEGLAIIGRATEGRVLGNDTLSRKLHRHPIAWGQSVVYRVESKQSQVSTP